jgi:hypothetical protein
MRKYRVAWTENHEIDVEAQNEDEAIDEAYFSDVDKTKQNSSLLFVKCLGGFCEEHNVLFSGEGCQKCSGEPQGDGAND